MSRGNKYEGNPTRERTTDKSNGATLGAEGGKAGGSAKVEGRSGGGKPRERGVTRGPSQPRKSEENRDSSGSQTAPIGHKVS